MKLKRTKNASWKIVDNEGVILHLKTGNYYSLNGMGLKIWELCDGKHNLEAIKSQIAKNYAVPPVKAGADVEKFVTTLHKEKLVEIS